ncbi:MAG: MBL fold metallo-hydrolase [Clostridia bacterium]
MNIYSLKTGPIEVNTYIITGNNKTCVVIDPGSSKEVIELLRARALTCTHILLTHGHFDHILGLKRIKDEFLATVIIQKDDADALESDRKNLGVFSGFSVEKCPPDVTFDDNYEFDAAALHFRAIHTPGHSRGSVCYVLDKEKIIFSGDTLFNLGIGRTDLPGGSEEDILDSITFKLYALPGDFKVFPGHERETTLEYEKNNNPYTFRTKL